MKPFSIQFHFFSILLLLLLCICSISVTQAQCDNCMPKMPMAGCPDPSYCGFEPIPCVNCTVPSPITCPNATQCTGVSCIDCVNGIAKPKCPDPGTCGYKPLACKGCSFNSPNSTTCPDITVCGNHESPPCYKCDTKPGDPYGCPNPLACGYALKCVDCMCSMHMDSCPNPELCGLDCSSTTCSMAMTFGTPDSVCVLFSSWDVNSASSWAGVIFAIFGTALLREFLIVCRQERILVRNRRGPRKALNDSLKNETNTTSACEECVDHFGDSIYYTVSILLAYALMLVMMTYHVALFFAVIGLTGLSNFLCTYGLTRYRKHYRPASTNFYGGDSARGLLVEDNSSNMNASQSNVIRTASDPCCGDLELNDDF